MKKRTFTLALVVLFALSLVPIVAVADATLPAPTVDDFGGHDHWGWSYENGSLPGLRNATGIRVEFDFEPGQVEFVIQSPAEGTGWWDHPGATAFEGKTLEVIFEEFTEHWEEHAKQDQLHLVFGSWDDNVGPGNVVKAEIIGEVLRTPYQPGVEDPVLDPPTVDDFGGHDHWGWSMENNSLPLNMSGFTSMIIEFDIEPGQVEFVIQSPAEGTGWWDHPGATEFDGNTLEIVFADWTEHWEAHIQQDMMHIVFGSWDDSVKPSNVVKAQLIGVVEDGIPNPDAGPAREIGPEGTLPYDMGLGGMIWGDQENQLGWNGDTRAVAEGAPFAGANEEGGLTAGLLVEANWFVVYVDNAPDDEIAEMLELVIFGNANGWGWSDGTMSAPTVQIYDTFVPGAIAFPIGGHPYIEAVRGEGEDELENRNFGICFTYEGGIANLGITSVMLYDELPGDAAPAPEPPAPAPEPPAPAPEPPAPAPAPAEGFPWWGWALIGVGIVAVVVVVVVVIKNKKD